MVRYGILYVKYKVSTELYSIYIIVCSSQSRRAATQRPLDNTLTNTPT